MDRANSERIKAIVSAIVVLVVNIASLAGATLDQSLVSDIVCFVVVIVSTCYAIWKNHNFTEAAQAGQRLLNEIKASNRTAAKDHLVMSEEDIENELQDGKTEEGDADDDE